MESKKLKSESKNIARFLFLAFAFLLFTSSTPTINELQKHCKDTYGTAKVKMTDGQIGKMVEGIFDMRPYFIEQRLKLRTPMYSETAAYGHMGRKNETVTKTFTTPDGKTKTMKVELFTWEKLDYVAKVKKAFGLK